MLVQLQAPLGRQRVMNDAADQVVSTCPAAVTAAQQPGVNRDFKLGQVVDSGRIFLRGDGIQFVSRERKCCNPQRLRRHPLRKHGGRIHSRSRRHRQSLQPPKHQRTQALKHAQLVRQGNAGCTAWLAWIVDICVIRQQLAQHQRIAAAEVEQ